MSAGNAKGLPAVNPGVKMSVTKCQASPPARSTTVLVPARPLPPSPPLPPIVIPLSTHALSLSLSRPPARLFLHAFYACRLFLLWKIRESSRRSISCPRERWSDFAVVKREAHPGRRKNRVLPFQPWRNSHLPLVGRDRVYRPAARRRPAL